MSARLPSDWNYISHRRVGDRSRSGELFKENNCKWKFIATLICCAVCCNAQHQDHYDANVP